MRRGVFQITVFNVVSVVVLALSGCSAMNSASPHTLPPVSTSPTRLVQSAAPLSVYIGSTDGHVSALDAADGVVRWRSVVASSASTTTVAAVAEGAVFVSAANVNKLPRATTLAALRTSDGYVLWHLSLAGAAAVIATGPGVVFVALDGEGVLPHEILMLRALDGKVLWRTQIVGAGPLHASLHAGTIYVTSFTTQLPSPGYFYASTIVYALNASTGTVSWHSTLGRTDYLAAVADGAVYLVDTGTDVVCEPQALHVLSASDGMERWRSEGTLLRLIGMEQGRAFVAVVPEGCAATTYDHLLLSARTAGDGSTVWQADVSAAYGGLLAGDVIYLPGAGTVLAAYRAADGARLWSVPGESGRLWVLDAGLYTSIAGQGLDALDPVTGAVRWRYRPGDDVWSLTIADGILFGISSRQTTDSARDQAIIALTTSDGRVRWRFQIGTSAVAPPTPIVG
jgi:outer membrane protein assembly factor BamB